MMSPKMRHIKNDFTIEYRKEGDMYGLSGCNIWK